MPVDVSGPRGVSLSIHRIAQREERIVREPQPGDPVDNGALSPVAERVLVTDVTDATLSGSPGVTLPYLQIG